VRRGYANLRSFLFARVAALAQWRVAIENATAIEDGTFAVIAFDRGRPAGALAGGRTFEG
jgi:hypothetical protein